MVYGGSIPSRGATGLAYANSRNCDDREMEKEMFGYASDVIGMGDLSEEQRAQFAEFCDGAVATVGWSSPIATDDGSVFERDGELLEHVDEALEWDTNEGDIQGSVLTANAEEWLGFFVEEYLDLLSCSTDFGQHGHDYVLTAGRHGAGFWDRGYAKGVADRLTESAQGGKSEHIFWVEDCAIRYQ